MKQLFLIALVLFSTVALSTEDMTKFNSKEQEALYRELVKELRCPKCQNQNIADSNAVVAKDMRVKTKELIDDGQSKQEVIDYMVGRYGQFAHYQPPINAATILLWVLPVGFILAALGLILIRGKRKNTEGPTKATNDAVLDSELDELLSDVANKEKK